MGSSLVSQELLLIFHATVLSPKQMADQAIRPLCRRPLHGRATLCGCEDLFTSREVFVYYPLQKKALSEIYSMDYLSNVGFFVRTEHWTPSINVRGNRYVAVNDHLGCNWVFLTKCGAIKWKPLTHTHTHHPIRAIRNGLWSVQPFCRGHQNSAVQPALCRLHVFMQMSHFGKHD